ncbi:MAG: extracellular solute-binding protein [Caldilineaceae bacterium]|nr:extracellular solute-binding protein [Caldilineaceae bacterium]
MSDQKFSRRRFLLGSSVVATGAVLAACAPSTGSTGSTQSSGGAAAPSTEGTTIVFHSRLGSHADWHKQRVPLFEEQNPGITLRIDELDAAEMFAKIYAMAAGGTLGDVVWTYLNTVTEHLQKKVIAPLDDIIASNSFDTSVFWPSILQTLTVDGKLYGIPNHGHYGTVVYYFNKSLYENAGTIVPNVDWTTDDLVTGAQAVTQAPETWGFRAQMGSEHTPSYLRSFGGELLSPDGTTCLLGEEGSVAALRWLYDLKETYKVDPCICGDQYRENFVAGKVGAFNVTPGLVAEFSKVTDWSFEWDVTAAPVGPGGLRGSQVSGAGFCITPPAAEKHADAAFKVLDFFSTKEDGIEHVFGGAGSPGTRDDVWSDPKLAEFSHIYGTIQSVYPDGPSPWYFPANNRTSEFHDVLLNNLQAIWTNQVGFDEGLEQTLTLCQEVLDNDPL